MSEQRIANKHISKGKFGQAFQWQRISPYKTRSELSRLLDDLHASLPGMIERYQQDDDFWPVFQRAADPIQAVAMGFNLDYVSDRIDSMTAEFRADRSARSKLQQ